MNHNRRTQNVTFQQNSMKNKSYFSLRRFSYALSGISFLIKTERNPLIYLVVMAVVAAFGFYCGLSSQEWMALILAISFVWMAEALNTAVELLADEISEERRERLGRAKDVAAGGVLLAALGALAVGVIVFAPYFL